MGKDIEQLLHDVYYKLESPAAYSGIERVYAEARKRDSTVRRNDVRDFLGKQRVYTMHKMARRRFPRLRIRPAGLHTDWFADLAVFNQLTKHNDGYNYLMVCVDVLSRKVFAQPVRTKRSEDMIEAFEAIFKRNKDILPHKLTTDRGLEFQARKMFDYYKKRHILKQVIYSPDTKAALAERANRTIKERLYRYLSQRNTLRWVDVIQKIVNGINSTPNRTTGVAPNSVNWANARQLFERLYKNEDDAVKRQGIFEKGQIVRISKQKGTFEKGSVYPNYSDELFRIQTVDTAKKPITYTLQDLAGEEIIGKFYLQELVPTSLEETTHRVAEVLKTRTLKSGRRQHFVRWIGYSDKFNSWINESDIVN